ncbi:MULTISPECIES: hypothetical protein [unclassified Nostoc]|uniref:hypothetical protein n=1 Tax=unclassified Nostoc TaxID=2593658 RepID=UPI0026375EB7|nr:hypothetical protein [Nostoc sp. S13]MDF5735155.1 hypothetical protein [Nostoc sp. S13]
MAITKFLPHLKELSHTDKLLLLHFLVSEIVNESGLIPLDTQGKTANLGLDDSFEAAAVLAKALAESKAAKNG